MKPDSHTGPVHSNGRGFFMTLTRCMALTLVSQRMAASGWVMSLVGGDLIPPIGGIVSTCTTGGRPTFKLANFNANSAFWNSVN